MTVGGAAWTLACRQLAGGSGEKAHSRTTCWKLKTSGCILQVVEKLIRGLAMEDSRNMFALFEYNGSVDKAIESRTIVADVLAKFEK